MPLRQIFHLTAWIFCLLCVFPGGGALAAESIEIVSPDKPHFAGQPLVFHIRTEQIVSPQRAAVYYRPRGISVFRKLLLEQKTPVDFRAVLEGRKVMPPGIEYYLVVEDQKGDVFTLPGQNPQQNPYFIDIDLDRTPPRITEIVPEKGAELEQTRPLIRIAFEDAQTRVDTGRIRLELDGRDVTRLSEITEDAVTYQPESGLAQGRHTITIQMADVSGNRMKPDQRVFYVSEPGYIDYARAAVEWHGETRRKILESDDNPEPAWKIQSRAGLDSRVESGKFQASAAADAWYTEEEGPGPQGDNFDLARFLARAEYGEQLAAVGDITVEGTGLISRSIARRGGRVEMNAAGVRTEGFALRSNTVTGFEHGLGIGDSDQQLVGGSVEKEFIRDKGLKLRAGYITGKNQDPDDYNAGSLEAGTEGSMISLALESRILAEKLAVAAEYCDTRFDSDVSDPYGQESDHAWSAKISGKGGSYDWQAGYTYLGPDFQNIANPTGANNREEYSASGGLRALSSAFRVSLFHNRDNADEDPLMPVIENAGGTLAWNLTRSGWPAAYVNYTINDQQSDQEPAGYDPIENQTQTVGCGFSVFGDRWSLSPGYTFTAFNDEAAAADNDSRTHTATLSGNLNPLDNLSINPSLSYTRFDTDAADQVTETYQATLGGASGFFDNQLSINATLSVLDNQTDDDSLHNTTFSGILQINWHIGRFITENSRQTFSVRGRYGRTEDHVTDNVTRDYSAYAILSFDLPVQLY
ncbi:MAG: hypothetical protein KGY42_06150 [Desulfobacterales bacterium]|nr:hypothetical protein [Desulfobacterales bacterium]MBS3756909.1 hypothetical protein [Desulfobacterales bacterium]